MTQPMTEQPYIDQLLGRIRSNADREAFVRRGQSLTYGELDTIISTWTERLASDGIGQGDCVGVLADYSPQSVGLAVALMRARAIFVPFSEAVESEMGSLMELGAVRFLYRFGEDDQATLEGVTEGPVPPLISDFRSKGVAGLVVFTSGSTGKPKGILHDCDRLAKKFSEARKAYRTLVFLLFDHFGGFNTMLSVLSFGGTLIVPEARTPKQVAKTVSETAVELLPVTPTLLNLMLISGAGTEYDLSSVKLITYGTEVMPEATLKRVATLAPGARLQQTYGLSELGVLRSRSKDSSSLWVKVGGAGFETRIVDDLLFVRSESAMIGYLNAPSPFDEDGWMCTGDRVEQRGEYLRILGRDSDLINVGGQKVFPAEVETALLEADNVDEATVYGEANKLMGAVVMARVKLREPEDPGALRSRLRKFCRERLTSYKIPVRFYITTEEQHNKRYKKQRPSGPVPPPDAMSIEIRPIRLDEVSVLQEFIRKEWNAQHAFVHSRDLLLWQHHLNPFKALGGFEDDELSFWGAFDEAELVAVLGEIPVGFSIRGETLPGTWLALWKNRAESEHTGAGIQLMRQVTSRPVAFVGGIGMNERVRGAYGLFRFQVFEDLPLYVVLNPDVNSPWVRKKATFTEANGARFFPRASAQSPAVSGAKLTIRPLPAKADDWDVFWSRLRGTVDGTDRSFDYMNWRYVSHPHYQYEWIQVVDENGALQAAGVYRVEEAAGERTLHVVEFLGEGEPGERLAQALCQVMREREASFLGFRCARPGSFEPWRSVGGDAYSRSDLSYELPSLFQPVVPEYRSLVWGYRLSRVLNSANLSDFYVTRSDGDQDRPSRLGPAR